MLAKAAILGPRSQGDLCRTPGRKFGVDSVDTTMMGVCEHLLNEVRSYVYPLMYCIVYNIYIYLCTCTNTSWTFACHGYDDSRA